MLPTVMPALPAECGTPSPALTYLARLGPRSRRVQAGALLSLARMLWPHRSPQEALRDPSLWGGLTPAVCVAASARLRASHAPATAARTLSALRGTLKEAWRLGLITAEVRDRLLDLPTPRWHREPAGRCLDAGEIDALLNAASDRDCALLCAMIGGGLRREEAATLRARDVACALSDAVPNSGCAPVHRSTPRKGWDRGPSTPTGADARSVLVRLSVLGKGDRQRIVYIAGAMASRLAGWVAGRAPDDLVFGLATGGGVWAALARLQRAAGVPPFTPHDLRRTYASRALDMGVDIATVQASMGHADPRTTSRYDRRGERALAAAALRISEGA